MKIKNKFLLVFASALLATACSSNNVSKNSETSTSIESSSVTSESSSSSLSSSTSNSSSSQRPSSSQSKASSASSSKNSSSSSKPSSASSRPSSTSSGGGSQSGEKLTITTNLNEVKQIHTDRQKTFLSYSGNYATMPSNQYPDGTQFLSDPNSVNIAWNHTPIANKTLSRYSIIFGQKQDLSDGYEVVGTTAKSLDLINVFLGTNFFKIKAYYSDNTTEESEIKSFNVDETCPRNLKIDGLTNCRDLGGRRTVDGGYIKQGLLYRTSGNNFQTKSSNSVGKGIISDTGKTEMLKHLKMKTEINVNSSSSYNLSLTGTTVLNYNMDYGGSAAHHFSRNAESLKNYLTAISNTNNYPAYFHCRIGTDRTGLCGIMTNGLLGVPLNDIYQDYLFSNFGNIEEKRYIGSQAGQDNIENYINDVLAMAGTNLHNKFYNTLLAIGTPRQTLDNIINNLTEGPKASGNDAGQIVVAAKDMTLSGGTLKTASFEDRNNPESYTTLATGSSASFKINATKAFKGQLVAYLGNSDYSTSKTISGSIGVKLDSNDVSITNKNFQQAGMGNVSNRTNYYPVILGEVNISAGEHTFTISGKANNMNLANFCIFENGEASGSGETGGNESSNEIALLNTAAVDGQKTEKLKHDKGQYTEWDISSVPNGTYKLMLTCQMTSSNHGDRYWYNMAKHGNETLTTNQDKTSEDDFRYKFNVDSTNYNITNTKSYSENGMNNSSFTDVEMCTVNINNSNRLRITRCNIGYSVFINGIKLIKI